MLSGGNRNSKVLLRSVFKTEKSWMVAVEILDLLEIAQQELSGTELKGLRLHQLLLPLPGAPQLDVMLKELSEVPSSAWPP